MIQTVLKSSQSYGASLAEWDHTVLPDTSERTPP